MEAAEKFSGELGNGAGMSGSLAFRARRSTATGDGKPRPRWSRHLPDRIGR